jgi:hypothetical protein
MTDTKKASGPDESIASESDNAKLKHVAGDRTTRDDPLDAGVPMLPGDPSEPQGPEDALGIGPKRGDYTSRIGPDGYQPHQSVPIPADEQEEGGPKARLEAQRPRAEDIGDEKGVKGGTQTAPS